MRKVQKKRRISERRASKGHPNPIDVHVGNRIRAQRAKLGISQTRLAEATNLTFQQIQKYENGANRVSSSRLYDIAKTLDVPIDWFFRDMADATTGASPRILSHRLNKEPIADGRIPENSAEAHTLTSLYLQFESDRVRQMFRKLVFEIAISEGTIVRRTRSPRSAQQKSRR
jgi:transcriptional regulator with XRE-family HTH domain